MPNDPHPSHPPLMRQLQAGCVHRPALLGPLLHNSSRPPSVDAAPEAVNLARPEMLQPTPKPVLLPSTRRDDAYASVQWPMYP
eukprot:CAMPEP_0177570060 /NCGR_PEP_ID=MMETSP0369-20130122/76634_1 /TAXON_ID=447022 ORGANISM="Scrippsiella hangoei-like, Strain SHHI-4" /NCGR_SAMPLE_ID=MMETSP0369 /ASSEMBLY_ACC=CAM_ASM_000364 /LENGTH=82 /DNA_ID=CAMNT_0019057763 /DNA_START=5 /DNA_END=250 /DNA_ORIENTATION=+